MEQKVVLGPQRIRRSATRDRVLRASVELLLESGVGAISAKAVAERAGLSRGALLKQYPTSGQLVAALTEHVIRESAEFAMREADALPDGLASLRVLFRRAWEDLKTPLFQGLLEIVISSRCNRDLQKHMAEAGGAINRTQLANTLPFFRRLGISDDDVAELLFLEFVATMRGLVIERLFTGDIAKVERVFEHALDNFVTRIGHSCLSAPANVV